jgi:hypothetical protein
MVGLNFMMFGYPSTHNLAMYCMIAQYVQNGMRLLTLILMAQRYFLAAG